MSINIRRDNDDPFYRYKMPPIQSKIEGRGNGIKTAVVNTGDVARALDRPPSYLIKWFGAELGAQTSINDSQDRYLVNGAHDSGKLQDSLDGFINKFVLCGSCKNPETDFIIHRDGTVEKDCKACGSKTLVDPGHKVTSFIAKNPPATSKSKRKGVANAGSSTAAKGDDDAKDEDAVEDEGRDDDELTRRINAEAAALPAMKHEQNDDEVEWAADLSEEAVRARQRRLEKTMAVLSVEEDDTSEDVYNEFGEWILDSRPSDVDIFKRVTELNIASKPKTVQVLAQTLFDAKNIADQIPNHAPFLRKMVISVEHEKALLGGIERWIGIQHPELISQVPNILFKIYYDELVGEEVLLKWCTKVSKRYVDKNTSKKVRRAAKPFLEWLQDAESESDDDNESDDE